jgi:hypothetical protein
MKLKLLSGLAVIGLLFSSCNKDEINDLEARLDQVESRIGNDPISFKYTSSYTDGTPIVKNGAYFFKSTGESTHYLEDYGDGTYGVYVERFADVDWNQYAWFYFEYDGNTKEVTYSSAGIWFTNSDWNYINCYVYPGSYTENAVTVTVKSFNAETGSINVTVHATTTDNSDNNNSYVSKKAQTLDLTYKGQLEIFDSSNNM